MEPDDSIEVGVLLLEMGIYPVVMVVAPDETLVELSLELTGCAGASWYLVGMPAHWGVLAPMP